MDTTEVLQKGQVSLTPSVALSPGIVPFGVGSGLRVRVGVGERHEFGVEGAGSYGEHIFGYYAAGGRLSWKFAPTGSLGLLAGTSVQYTGGDRGSDLILLGDLGLIVAASRPVNGVRPYGALRVGLGPTVGVQDGGFLTWHQAAFGYSSGVAPWFRFFFEGGYVGSLARGAHVGHDHANVKISDNLVYAPRGYFAVGMSFILDRRR